MRKVKVPGMIRYLSAMSMLLSGLVDSNSKSLVQRCAFVLTVCLSVWTALGEELLRVGSAVVPPDQLEALLSTPIRTGAAMRRQSGNALFSLAANEKDKKLIVVNPLTRVNAVFDCPAQSARIKVKITPLLMAE